MITTHTVTPTNTPDTKFAMETQSRVSAGFKKKMITTYTSRNQNVIVGKHGYVY